MTPRPMVGLLGGTFDPIHCGHLAVARAAQRALTLDRVWFVPSARPPHRPDSPQASEYHRVAMIRLATQAGIGWEVSDLELRRHGPSYTYDTLTTLGRDGLAPSQIFFITGADAFAEIATWYRYPEVLDLAHFVVVARPGFSIEALRGRVPALADRMIQPAELADPSTPRVILVAADTPDVSSTAIRSRVARRESLDGLVPSAVSAYISQHDLYSSGH
jgi:nicotinate-nucleotide adenylyltransferase